VKTCEYDGELGGEPRSHPWSDSVLDSGARYHDLSAHTPFERYSAIEEFYSLLERLNHPKSVLESSDCAFSGPRPSESRQRKESLECSGRLMILYRALEQNTLEARLAWLRLALHQELAELDPKFTGGIIGTTLVPIRYLALPEGSQLGQQLMLSFWAFGDSEASLMLVLARLFRNLSRALRHVSARIIGGA
jgi:hypothetical protein